MGTSKINISHAPEGQSRPSLLSTGAPSADHNILDAMGAHEDKPARSRRHRWLLLPLIAATVWGISTQLAQPPLTHPVALPAPRPATPAAAVVAVASAPDTTAAVPALATATSAEASAPATTSTTNPFSGLDASTATTASLAPAESTRTAAVATRAPERTSSTPPPFDLQAALDKVPPRTAPPAKPAPEAASKRATPEKAVVASKPAAPPTSSKPAQVARKSSAQPETKSGSATGGNTRPADSKQAVASNKPPSRDPDVELLSAIMKHLNEGKGSAAATPPQRSAQTIADLVRSCKTKDSIDALLCQRRICEGSWGKAQACPMSQAPKTAQTQTNH